jgi:hypothetical protein
MRKFIISAAATTAFVALLTSAPAMAEYNYGPMKNGDQCWNGSSYGAMVVPGRAGGSSNGFGYWAACAAPASATPAPAPKHRRHHTTSR